MSASKLTEGEFVEQFRTLGPDAMARQLGLDPSNIHQRRRDIERRRGIEIRSPNARNHHRIPVPKGEPRIDLSIKDGHVVVGSDFHYWPGDKTLLHDAFVWACKEFKPKAVILNGDVMDLPQISRHDPIGWESWPKVHEEIEWAQDRTHEIAQAAGRAEKIWTFGNHDKRFESRLASVAPEFGRLNGFHLKDSFPLWRPCWLTVVNSDGDAIWVKHRFKGGIHAPHNNTLWAGAHIVTGHLHSAKVMPISDTRGTRYGVDTGCVAEPNARAFQNYTELSPLNWRSAFGLLTIKDGRLLQPELVLKWDDKRVQFRGEVFAP